MPKCFTFTQGLSQLDLDSFFRNKASKFTSKRGFSFSKTKFTSQSDLILFLGQKHLGFMVYFPARQV